MSGKTPEISVERAGSEDKASVMSMLGRTNFFRPEEITVAEEVYDDAVAKGPQGDYQSFVARDKQKTIGWVCFGATPCAVGTFDIYWIVVEPEIQNRGIGKYLMGYVADHIKNNCKGRMLVVDTSGSPRYISTRRFYEKLGYRMEACIRDFYTVGDDKVIYVKRI